MAFNEKIKYFMYGLLLGSKQLERERGPLNIPVTRIEIGYVKDTFTKGESGLLTATIYPINASFKEVEWYSSDINVVAVNKLSPLACELITLETGTVTITCRATDGYGAEAKLIVNVQAGPVFTSLAFNRYDMQGYIYFPTVAEGAMVFDYEPKTMNGNKFKLEVSDMYSGKDKPYKISDTGIGNIKKIKVLTDLNRPTIEDYISRINNSFAYIDFTARTTDGSGIVIKKELSVTTSVLNYASNTVRHLLFGTGESTYNINGITYTYSRNIPVGWNYLILNTGNGTNDSNQVYQCWGDNNYKVEIDDPDGCIEINNNILTAKKVGTCTVKVSHFGGWNGVIQVGDIVRIHDITVIEEPTEYTSGDVRNSVALYDSKGQLIQGNYVMAGRKVFLGAIPVPFKLRSISTSNPEEIKINYDNSIEFIKGASNTSSYIYDIDVMDGTSMKKMTGNSGLNAQAVELTSGVVTSEYMDAGKVACCCSPKLVSNNNSSDFFDCHLIRLVDCIFNADELRLYETFFINNMTSNLGLTFNPTSANRSPNKIYVFEKLTSGPAKVRFQLHNNSDVYTEVTI